MGDAQDMAGNERRSATKKPHFAKTRLTIKKIRNFIAEARVLGKELGLPIDDFSLKAQEDYDTGTLHFALVAVVQGRADEVLTLWEQLCDLPSAALLTALDIWVEWPFNIEHKAGSATGVVTPVNDPKGAKSQA